MEGMKNGAQKWLQLMSRDQANTHGKVFRPVKCSL